MKTTTYDIIKIEADIDGDLCGESCQNLKFYLSGKTTCRISDNVLKSTCVPPIKRSCKTLEELKAEINKQG